MAMQVAASYWGLLMGCVALSCLGVGCSSDMLGARAESRPAADASAADAQPGPEASRPGVIFRDDFSDGDDAGWTQISRVWHVRDGRYVLDGDYTEDSEERGGYSVIHVGDRTWCDYAFNVTFDNSNPPGLPSEDVHNVFLLLRLGSSPPFGKYYRIDIWPIGTTDPRDGEGFVPGGLVHMFKFVDAECMHTEERTQSNTVVGINTVTVRAVRGSFSIAINGAEVLAWTDDDPIPCGGVGLGAIWEAEAAFDDVVVEEAG
jgi:hypothetical protein